MKHKVRRIHFVGIGGSGMSGIAEVLFNLGYQVSGSDLAANAATRRLEQLGVALKLSHAADNVGDADAVVVSSAVKSDNPEVLAARARRIPVVPRALMLAELMRLKQGIAIAGTHGKTTTTSLIASVLAEGGLDPTYVIGGRLTSSASNARLGAGDFIVVEADESDASFLHLQPVVAVVTNIDADHMDTYQHDFPRLQQAFIQFLHNMPFYGSAVLCADDPHVREIMPFVSRPIVTYGLGADAMIRATDVALGPQSRFHVSRGDQPALEIALNLPGRHNVLNALAAAAVGLDLEMPFDKIQASLASFAGVQRRFQIRGEAQGVLVVDDYGHHPAEIRATLAAAKAGFDRRVVTVFQPHRYSRTQHLFNDFLTAFYQSDVLIVMDIYAAGEAPIPGVHARDLADGIAAHGHREVLYLGGDRAAIVDYLCESTRAGDLVLTLGAGDVGQLGGELLKRLGPDPGTTSKRR